MSKGNLTKNTIFFTSAMAMQKIISFVYFIFIARMLGADNTGKFSFALTFTTIFAIFLDFGTNQILIRESARKRENSQRYLSSVLGFKVLSSLLVYGVMALVVNLMGYPEITKQMVYVAGFVMIVDSFVLSNYAILRGHQNLRYESGGVVLNQIIVLAVGLLVLKMNLGLVVLVAVYLLGSLFNAAYSGLFLGLKLKIFPRLALDWELVKKILKISWPFALAGLFVRIYSSIDVVMLSKMTTDTDVGIYSVAYKMAFALQFVAVAFSASIYPAFCKYFVESKEDLKRVFVKSMFYLMALAMPLTAGVVAIADRIIGPVFGWEYDMAVMPLQILMLAMVLIFIGFPLGAMLNAANRQARNMVHLGVVALFNILVNLVLIPMYGYNGAAIGAFLSYIVLVALGLYVTGQIIDYDKKYLIKSFFKILVSCVIMGGLVYFGKSYLNTFVVIGLGVVIYSLALYAVGGIKKDDIGQLVGLLKNK